jgi:hypothetical protein
MASEQPGGSTPDAIMDKAKKAMDMPGGEAVAGHDDNMMSKAKDKMNEVARTQGC